MELALLSEALTSSWHSSHCPVREAHRQPREEGEVQAGSLPARDSCAEISRRRKRCARDVR